MAKGLRSKSLRKAKAIRRVKFHQPVEERRLKRVTTRDASRLNLGVNNYKPNRIIENDIAISLLAAKIDIVQERLNEFDEFQKAISTTNVGPQFSELMKIKLEAALGDAEQAYKLNESSYVARDALLAAKATLQSYLTEISIDDDHENVRTAEEDKGTNATFSFKKALDSIKSKTELQKELNQYRIHMRSLEKRRVYLKEREEAGKLKE